jgi:SAM-dependent methyltransferase
MEGARTGFTALFAGRRPASLLDVGCGTATWLRAAIDAGVGHVRGIEGLDLPQAQTHVAKPLITVADLNEPVDLGERFDAVLCLEVVHLLRRESADTIVDTLIRHGDHIFFSAGVPGQGGIQHINCQWPAYWQALFNARGYVCSDEIRWRIWDDKTMEPWYRQNMMEARRDPERAGKEARIRSVIHPDALASFAGEFVPTIQKQIEEGGMLWGWYLRAPFKAAAAKIRHRMHRRTAR